MSCFDGKNANAYESIKNIINSDKIPHSYIVEGGTYDDRIAFADYLSKGILCEGEEKPCDNCKQCHLSSVGSNPDITKVTLQDGKKNISVAQIRKIREDAYIKPHSAKKRIFIIETAEYMNEQAQNALLKVLEEPPMCVVFILLTPSRLMLLETIISRCSLFLLNGEENAVSDEMIAQAEKLLDMIFDGNEYEILKELKAFEKDRMKAEKLFSSMNKVICKRLATENISKTRGKILYNIYSKNEEYIEMLKSNINTALLFSGAVCQYKTFIDMR